MPKPKALEFAEAHEAAEALRPEPLTLRWSHWMVRDDGRTIFKPNAPAWTVSAEDMMQLWEWIGQNYLPPRPTDDAVRACAYTSAHVCPRCDKRRSLCYVLPSFADHRIHYVCGLCGYRWTDETDKEHEEALEI